MGRAPQGGGVVWTVPLLRAEPPGKKEAVHFHPRAAELQGGGVKTQKQRSKKRRPLLLLPLANAMQFVFLCGMWSVYYVL